MLIFNGKISENTVCLERSHHQVIVNLITAYQIVSTSRLSKYELDKHGESNNIDTQREECYTDK